jgi:hypothetical protein
MLEFFIDNIFLIFGGRVFQQTVGIPMGTNCGSLLADLFFYSYTADFIQGLLKKNGSRYEADLYVYVVSFISSSIG